ncbi:MAG TPA: hypothetical protein VFQ53_43690 [Kofleriaceae bacterium]|nr:hypothetical protein [Kofleriaceae bacterium]
MDLEIREALALSDDRTAALGQLLPGSEDHDFYRCLHAQHAGALDEADQILHAWPERHGHTERYERLRLRQLLYRVTREPARAADEVRDHFSVSHWHEAEVEEIDPTRPTRLADGVFDPNSLLQQAIDYDTNLSQVTDEGLLELVARPLDPARRRVLLSRIRHTPQPEIVQLVADDLGTRGSSGFGSLAIHDQLTLDQLRALADRMPELRGHFGWVSAVVRRMRPHHSIDLDLDRETRTVYLEQLWSFVGALPPAINTLKAHVLWHLLDTLRRRAPDAPIDPALVRTYLSLPRSASYVAEKWLERERREHVAQLGQDLRGVTGLPAPGQDEELVRDLLQRDLANAMQYAQWLDRAWLERELAEAQLLAGHRDADRATLVLGPERAAALRDRIELAWCVHNPTRFAADQPIALDADVKNVGELVVKVFRIDPVAYFQHHRREVDTDLDLDGLAASHELVMRIAEPPVRRVRRSIELPQTLRPGTYVIDLIGNGKSSRALVHKGRLRHLVRVGAAGHVVTILDDAGRPRPDARAWLGDREYVPDERAQIVVPFSTQPSRAPMLLVCGDVTTVAYLQLVRETYQLAMNLVLDRETLAAGRTAKAIARVALTVAGAPASLALVKRATWEVTLTDRAGVSTTKSQPLELVDRSAAVLEWPIGEDTAQVAIAIRGVVEVRSEQREQELVDARSYAVGTIHAGTGIEAMYLARTAAGWVVSALGKTGEPRAQRPMSIAVVHRWARTQLTVELATDAHGRVELGPLPGVEWIVATLGSLTQRWLAGEHGIGCSLAVVEGRDVVVPVPPGRTADDVIRRMSLVELRGGAPARHLLAPALAIEALEGGVVLRGLPAGDYDLRAPGINAAITVAPAGPELAGTIVTPGELLETPRPPAVVASVAATSDGLRIALRGHGAATRVHVIATRFSSALVEQLRLGPSRVPDRRVDRERAIRYVSGRELGDEYRYILDRRSQKRYPSLLLDKPGLLLNPWSRRTTTTGVADARAGDQFHAYGPPPVAAAAPAPARPQPAQGYDEAFASYDFLPAPTAYLANLAPDASGVVAIAATALGDATCVTIVVDDPSGTTLRRVVLPERPLAPRDLRLQLALEPDRHATQQKSITPLPPGGMLVIEDLATARVHLVDTVERAHAYLLSLSDEPTLRELSFVTKWHTLPDGERRERYSKYACHELHLFLYFKDRAFFDAIVRPYLAHKRTKTFLDHWLLDADLTRYLEPMALARLNAVERALLAQRLPPDDQLARVLGDQVAIQPPDPLTDTRLIDAMLGASTLDADEKMAELQEAAVGGARQRAATTMLAAGQAVAAAPSFGPPGGAPMDAVTRAAAPAKRKAAMPAAEMAADYDEEAGDDDLARDVGKRDAAPAFFRSVDKTQEWAENNWWHETAADCDADLIEPNRLWRDLAAHRDGRGFLSGALGLATSSFHEAMCALAVIDLPFVAAQHAMVADGPRLAITAAGNLLAGCSQLVEAPLVPGGLPLVVGTSYVRTDDRYEWESGEQRDKYVTAFATGIVYTCQVVLANPTSTRQRIAALVQIPRGSVPVASSRVTHTLDIVLEPYGTHGHEYSFYFPAPGQWTHFPVHVTRAGAIVAADAPRTLAVTTGGAVADPRSWSHVSQRGTIADVVSYLATANLAAIDLERVAWRLRDRAAYDAILSVLEQRRVYDEDLWGYALLHRDAARIRTWLRAKADELLAAGPVLDMLGTDAEKLAGYEHLELAPLVNARAHRLGPKLRILNDGLAAQYDRYLELVTHRPVPTAEDLLAGAMYLVTQDRHDDALGLLARVRPDAVADRMQHDYLAAYLACIVGDVGRARDLAARWRDHPVDRWRYKFGALHAMLDEVTAPGTAPAILDPRSRDQQQADAAARQPTFELALDRDGITLRSQHVTSLELRFFEMDIELLFSRQPFVQSDVSRFSFIEPGHREQLGELPPEYRLAWPAALRGKNVVVEAVGAGQRKAKVHYANDLTATLSSQVGQLRIQRASDRAALPATYVKVYARKQGGSVAFYKDGYTDLRGWFDYASLSTNDLDHVERFAILVASDAFGASILEAAPPVR